MDCLLSIPGRHHHREGYTAKHRQAGTKAKAHTVAKLKPAGLTAGVGVASFLHITDGGLWARCVPNLAYLALFFLCCFFNVPAALPSAQK